MGNGQGNIRDEYGNIVSYQENFGYKVIEAHTGSIAEKCGLEPFLDFVLYSPSVTGTRQLLFSEYLIENIGKSIVLRVYNLIQQGIRLVHLDLTKVDKEAILKEKESGNSRPTQELLLGAKMRYEQFDEAHHNILSV
jgi:hypothetical protein